MTFTTTLTPAQERAFSQLDQDLRLLHDVIRLGNDQQRNLNFLEEARLSAAKLAWTFYTYETPKHKVFSDRVLALQAKFRKEQA